MGPIPFLQFSLPPPDVFSSPSWNGSVLVLANDCCFPFSENMSRDEPRERTGKRRPFGKMWKCTLNTTNDEEMTEKADKILVQIDCILLEGCCTSVIA